MKRLVLGLMLMAAPSWAQATKQAMFSKAYDLDSASYIFCNVTGQLGDPWGPPIPGLSPIATSGPSTTVVEVTASSLPFANLGVGDIIFTTDSTGAAAIRAITAKASGASITVDSAINLGTSTPFSWKKLTCGTTAESGWISVQGWLYKKVSVHLNQMDATSIDIKWECRDRTIDTQPEYVYPGSSTASGVCPGGTSASGACNYTAASIATRTSVEVDVPYDQCRVGMKINTDDGLDTTTHAESITAWVTVWSAK